MTLAYQEYYTVDDYSLWKGDWELIEGMPYAMSPSPKVSHQISAGKILTQLNNSLDNQKDKCGGCHALMETDWQISNNTVVRPDVMIVCKEIKESVLVTPELIVEIVSVSSTKRDEQMKFDLYQQEGVLYYLLVYPEKKLAKVYINKDGGFQKIGDFSFETNEFQINDCYFPLDFSVVWRT